MLHVKKMLRLCDLSQVESSNHSDCLELAGQCASELHLLQVTPDGSQTMFGSSERVFDSAQDTILFAQEEPKVTVVRAALCGNLVPIVKQYVDEHHIDLIVLDDDFLTTTPVSKNKTIAEFLDTFKIPVLVMQGAYLTNIKLREAFSALREELGSHCDGEQLSLRTRMLDVIKNEMSVSESVADTYLDRLIDAGRIRWAPPSERLQDQGLGRYEFVGPQSRTDTVTVTNPEFASPAISLIERAMEVGATDIHIDPVDSYGSSVQFRVDGRMEEFCRMQRSIAQNAINQVKVLAQVTNESPHQPSSGRLTLPEQLQNVEARFASAPVAQGEAVALHLIDTRRIGLPLDEIGFAAENFGAAYKMLHQLSGLVLIAGPSGSGRTTTAYSLISLLHRERLNIVSLENPIELVVPFMRQVQVDEKRGFSMKDGLSTVMRLGPDVAFIGEIDSPESANIALQIAGSGRRTFSTIRQRDAAACVTALKEHGLSTHAISNSLAGLISQRLVRKLCSKCRQQTDISETERRFFDEMNFDAPESLWRSRGCASCRGNGYRGRVGIFEAVAMEERVLDAIRAGLAEVELRRVIREVTDQSLIRDGLLKVRDGITTLEELTKANWLDDVSLTDATVTEGRLGRVSGTF